MGEMPPWCEGEPLEVRHRVGDYLVVLEGDVERIDEDEAARDGTTATTRSTYPEEGAK